MKIAIIGAGIGGLTLARELAKKANVTLFEKARGVGGRMSTRYADPFYFDHGAQCFTARSKEFQAFLKPYMDAGIVAEWKGKVINLELGKKETKRMWFEPHLVASPNMNSLCKKLAEGINIFFSKRLPLWAKKNLKAGRCKARKVNGLEYLTGLFLLPLLRKRSDFLTTTSLMDILFILHNCKVVTL